MQRKKRLRQHSVRVITPYTAQREAIVKQLEEIKKLNCFKELKIGSVAETQGKHVEYTIAQCHVVFVCRRGSGFCYPVNRALYAQVAHTFVSRQIVAARKSWIRSGQQPD